MQAVQTAFGEVRVKLKILDGGVVQAAPEYGDCLRLAEAAQIPVGRVYTAAVAASEGLLS
jgi:uncharacterized protein (DUF111 family)